MPQVSVVIPVFNSSHYVGGALRSVFAQTFHDYEVIVVDDGSDDREALLHTLAEFTVQYIRQENGGPAKARNTGVARACGELIAFLDADDEWSPDKLAMQVQYFREHRETGLLHSAVIDGTRDGALSGPPRRAFCELYHTDFYIRTLTVMLPRRVFNEVGGFDERREIHVEDWDLWLRIAVRYPIGYIATPLAYHRPGGLMSSQIDRTYEAQLLVMDKNRTLCEQACALHRSGPESCERRRRHVLHRGWGHDLLEIGDRRGARRQLATALRLEPLDRWSLRLYLSSFASGRWRARARTLLAARRRASAEKWATASISPRTTSISLVHDTTYRRLRRGVIGTFHDIDDRVSRRTHDRRRVLFEAASAMSFTIFRPLYDRLKRDPRVEMCFTAYSGVADPEQIFRRFGISEGIVSQRAAEWLKVDAYVNADFWDMTWLRRRTRRLHLFHGVAGKYGLDAPIDLALTVAAFDCLMFINDDRRQRYIDAGLVLDSPLAAPLVGYPKVDCLVDGSLDQIDILRSLGLSPSTPTVLYAPTWSPDSSLNAMGEEVIERLASQGLQVIVKLHDRSYDRRPRGSGGIDWSARLTKYHDHPSIRVAHDADGTSFMAAADAMVSDHSSIAFEYTLLNRPIVIIDRPDLIERASINPEKVRLLRNAAVVVGHAAEVADSVLRVLRSPHQLAQERATIARTLFYEPGTATDRALMHLYRILELPVLTAQPAETTAKQACAVVG
jgi:glycosyltransferase involved in cell wall biosynthesis